MYLFVMPLINLFCYPPFRLLVKFLRVTSCTADPFQNLCNLLINFGNKPLITNECGFLTIFTHPVIFSCHSYLVQLSVCHVKQQRSSRNLLKCEILCMLFFFLLFFKSTRTVVLTQKGIALLTQDSFYYYYYCCCCFNQVLTSNQFNKFFPCFLQELKLCKWICNFTAPSFLPF